MSNFPNLDILRVDFPNGTDPGPSLKMVGKPLGQMQHPEFALKSASLVEPMV